MRWLLAAWLAAQPLAASELADPEAIFARARAIAAQELPGVAAADLAGFRIAYALTRLETGDPDGSFEVDLLLRSSRSVLAADEVIAATSDTAAAARLRQLLAGTERAWYYRTVRVRFSAGVDAAAEAGYSTVLLNRDPEATGTAGP